MSAKDQHTLPRFWLSGFTIDRFVPPRTPALFWWRPEYRAWSIRAPENLTVKRHYYSVETDDGKDTSVETAISKIEDSAAKALRRLTSSTRPPDSDIFDIAVFVALQALRTPWWHRIVEKMANRTAEDTLHRMIAEWEAEPGKFAADMKRYNEATGRALSSQLTPAELKRHMPTASLTRFGLFSAAFIPLDDLTGRLLRREWILATSQRPDFFVASDNPFGTRNPNTDPRRVADLSDDATEISLPLSKTLALIAISGEPDIHWVEADVELVELVNLATANHSNGNIYAPLKRFPGSAQLIRP